MGAVLSRKNGHRPDRESNEDGTDANVARFLPAMAAGSPQRVAVRAPVGRERGGVIRYRESSFAELEAVANGCARILHRQGVVPGSRVLLMVRPGLPLIQLCFALFKLRAVPVVIDPGMGMRGFLACVRRTQPGALIGVPLAIALSRILRGSFASVESRVTVSGAFLRRCIEARGPAPVSGKAKPQDLAAVLFTSGSTGPAKGVRYEHGMFDAQVRMLREAYQIEPGEIDLPMLPIFALFNPALGMTTVVPEMNPSRPAQVDPARIVRAIQQNGVSNSFGSPVLWRRIVSYCEERGECLPSLKRVLMAGAPAPVDLLKRLRALLPDGEVHTPYGATECLPVSTISASEVLQETWEQTLRGAGTCVGRPVPGVSVRVEEPETFKAARLALGPVGTRVGEILVTGPSVTKAYDRLPEATRRSKFKDEAGRTWHRMGDAGYVDERERIWFCGRLAEVVVTPQRVYLTDPVEAVFNQLPGVARSALIGLGEAPGQTPAIVVEPEPGQRVLLADLRRQAERFELTRAIDHFFYCRAFPVDVRHNAKIHRLALKRRFEKRKA